MFVKVRHRQRKHGHILYVVLGWSERPEFKKTVKFFDSIYLGSIRESHLDDPAQLLKFWQRVRDTLLENFSAHDCDLYFKKIGRDIPRPRRLYGSENGFYFSCFNCPPYTRGRKH